MTAALLTTRQLAAYLGVHVNTVYRLPIPFYRVGTRDKRFSMDDVDAEAEPMPPPHTLLKLRPMLGILGDAALEFDLIDPGQYTAQEFITWIQLQYLGRPNIGIGGQFVLRAGEESLLRSTVMR